jgi:hypothetical protein
MKKKSFDVSKFKMLPFWTGTGIKETKLRWMGTNDQWVGMVGDGK